MDCWGKRKKKKAVSLSGSFENAKRKLRTPASRKIQNKVRKYSFALF
jgi:hypothetical protein